MAGPRIALLQLSKPVQRYIQRVSGNPEPRISERFVVTTIPLLEDGDLLLSRENWRLPNLFVPGYWGHAAVYHQGRVIEAIGDYTDPNDRTKILNGVRSENVHRWFYQKDSIVVLRAKFMTKDERARIGISAKTQVGKQYDYSFIPSLDAFYCSELFVWAYNEHAKTKIVLREQFGVETSTPEDLYDMRDYRFEIIGEEKN